MHGLPPGPSAPPVLQTLEWVARPTAMMRRCQQRYGEPFTLRTLWADAPMVLVSEPEDLRRIFTAGADKLHAGASSAILEPLAGPEAVQGAVGLDEAVLGRFLGVGGVAADDVRDAEGDLLVFADERGVRGAVAAACALDQLVLCQWPAHHRS